MMKRLILAIFVLALAGVALSGVSLAHKKSFVSGTFCTINESFDCDLVNRGPYSEIAGVPVAIIGILGYGLLALGALQWSRRPEDRGLQLFVAISALGGLAFSLYLTSIEAFILHVWCLLCLTSQAVILTICSLTAYVLAKQRGIAPNFPQERI